MYGNKQGKTSHNQFNKATEKPHSFIKTEVEIKYIPLTNNKDLFPVF